jgi:glycogen operon protein
MDGLRELTTRLAGSADLFGRSDPPLMRGPVASINYVTAHDGFTLADLVSFDHKHNWANGEDNHDGTDNNLSWNHGVEGHAGVGDDETTEPWSAVVPLRRRSQRNLLAMLLLAAGTPMMTAGDEFGRTQNGNNNGYAQDNAISWVSWNHDTAGRELLETTKFLLQLRREQAALRADSFFLGAPRPDERLTDLLWFTEYGTAMDAAAWNEAERRVVQMLCSGPGPEDDDVLLVINGRLGDLVIALPPVQPGARAWELAWSSTWDIPVEPEDERSEEDRLSMEALSVKVFIARRG